MNVGRVRTTQWNLVFNYTAFVLIVVQGILLVPLYLKHIPLAQYGGWVASGNVLAWITVIDPGVSTVVIQRTAHLFGAKDYGEIVPLGIAGIIASAIIALVLLAIGLTIAPSIPAWVGVSRPEDVHAISAAFSLSVCGTALLILSYSVAAINQGLQSALGTGLIYVATMLCAIGVAVAMLLAGYGLLALGAAVLVRGGGLLVGNAAYMVVHVRRLRIPFRMSLHRMRELGSLTSYTFFGRLAGTVSQNVEAFAISRFLGVEQAAILSLTRRAPDSSRMLVERPSTAFMPALTHLYAEGAVERTAAIVVRLLCVQMWVGGLLVAGFLALNDDFVTLWIGSRFFAGNAVNAAVCIAFCFAVWSVSLGNLCYSLGNIKGNSLVALADGLLSVAFIVIGARQFGMIGAVLGPVAASLCLSAWYYPRFLAVRLRRGVPVLRQPSAEGFKTLIAMSVTLLVFGRLHPGAWPGFVGSVLLVVICYGAVLFASSAAFRGEATTAWQWVRRK